MRLLFEQGSFLDDFDVGDILSTCYTEIEGSAHIKIISEIVCLSAGSA